MSISDWSADVCSSDLRCRDSNLASRGELRISSLADSGEDRDRRFWSAMRALASRTSRATRMRLAHHVDGKFRPLLGPDWRQAMGDVDYDENDGMLAHYSGVVDLPAQDRKSTRLNSRH